MAEMDGMRGASWGWIREMERTQRTGTIRREKVRCWGEKAKVDIPRRPGMHSCIRIGRGSLAGPAAVEGACSALVGPWWRSTT